MSFHFAEDLFPDFECHHEKRHPRPNNNEQLDEPAASSLKKTRRSNTSVPPHDVPEEQHEEHGTCVKPEHLCWIFFTSGQATLALS